MTPTEILRSLPASLDWMVLFRLAAIRPWASDTEMKAMFHLPEAIDLAPFSHVVLGSQGRHLASLGGSTLFLLTDRQLAPSPMAGKSLFERFGGCWKLFQPDEA